MTFFKPSLSFSGMRRSTCRLKPSTTATLGFLVFGNSISSETLEDILAFICELYAVEREAGGDFGALARLLLEKFRGILARIEEWLIAQRHKALPRGTFAKSIDYTLTRFVKDARIPLDNNATESAARPARRIGCCHWARCIGGARRTATFFQADTFEILRISRAVGLSATISGISPSAARRGQGRG